MLDKCTVAVCDRTAEVTGLCRGHYARKRNGKPLDTPIGGKYKPVGACKIEGCTNQARQVGMCGAHYDRSRRGADLTVPIDSRRRRRTTPLPPCKVDGCARISRTLGLCAMHYLRDRAGKPLDDPLRVTAPPGARMARDSHGRKQCSVCEQWKEVTNYGPQKRSGDGLRSYCRPCARLVALRNKYGMTILDFELMFAAQGGGCAICNSTDPRGHNWCVDHDHTCCPGPVTCGSCVRGILCDPCNNGLGRFQDSVEVLRSAAAYLEQCGAHVAS